MGDYEEIKRLIEQNFSGKRYENAGFVQLVASKDDQVVLKKIDQMASNFIPVVYSGGALIFFVINEEVRTRDKSVVIFTAVLITNDNKDLDLLCDSLPNYLFNELVINHDSLSNYNQYLEHRSDKPFSGFAYTIPNLNLKLNLKKCCK